VAVGVALAPLAAQDHFERRVRPLLVEKCQPCHNGKVKMAGLDLQTGDGLPPLVTPGDPASSRLYQAIQYVDKVKMPPAGKLPDPERAVIRQWIEEGASWPSQRKASPPAPGSKLWSFQPIGNPGIPDVGPDAAGDWATDPIDRFLNRPAPPAGKLALLRRVTFDLTGLPPTLDEIDAFLADTSPLAYNKVVDRLLSSPRYGERWGRHWLDIARLADSTGMDEDNLYPHAWRYRDYVVQAFNDDLPIDQFIHQQVAGDLLPAATQRDRARNLTATGLLALGPRPLAQQDRLQAVYDIVDEQIDTVSKVFLGLTISCARCHDHKFDPILTTDYYALASIFASTRQFRNYGRPGSISYMHYEPLDPLAHGRYELQRKLMFAKQIEMEDALAEDGGRESAPLRVGVAESIRTAWAVLHQGAKPELSEHQRKWVAWLKSAKLAKFDNATADTVGKVAEELAQEYSAAATKWDQSLEAWRSRLAKEALLDRALPDRPKPDATSFFGRTTFDGGPMEVRESARVRLLRQEWEQLGKTMPAEPAMVSAVVDGPSIDQRVFVRGNLHNPGEPVAKRFPLALSGENQPPIRSGSGRLELARWLTSPSNPLTARVFVNRVWLWHFGEGLVRTTSNWGATGERPTHPELLDHLARRFMDGGWRLRDLHRWILLSSAYRSSRFPRTRLSIEQIRDTYLALDGSLDSAVGGQLTASAGKRQRTDPDEVRRRTLYLPVRRGSIPPLLAMFDFGDATTPGEARARTNVAPQALFVRNSRFAVERARGFAKLLLADAAIGDSKRIERAYLMALTRVPEPAETDEALSYIAAMEARIGGGEARETAWRSFCHLLMSSNEFLY
jgi:hypothetical protein